MQITKILGLTESEAKRVLTQMSVPHRIVSKNGAAFVVTQDFRPERANLSIQDGRVNGISYG